MRAERITGTILLSATLLLSILFSFVAFGYTADKDEGTTTTETYHLFWMDREVAPSNDLENPSSELQYTYFDPVLDGSGGITFLRTAGPLFLVSILVAVVSLVLTVVPATSNSRAGGYVAIGASAGFLVSVALLAVGAQWFLVHTSTVGDVLARASGMYLGVALLLLVLVATGMGLVRTAPSTVAKSAVAAGTGWTAAPATPSVEDVDTRMLQCPDCATIVEAELHVVPTCPDCGFKSRRIQAAASPGDAPTA